MGEVGFATMGRADAAEDVQPIGVGMLGYAFMGKAHSNAYKTLAYMTWPPPLLPQLVAIAGRNEEAVAEAARRYGFSEYVTDWHALVSDERVQLFDNSGPNNLHAEPTIAAAEAGKHVICEKPLGRDAAESYETWQRVEAAGSGALGDLGAHVIDLSRYLVGEIETVAALTATFQPGRTVDDAVEAVVGFEGGAVGTIEASRFAAGRKNAFRWEINGSKGSIAFDLERLNELQVHFADSTPGKGAQGFRTVLVSEADHPFWEHWWPHGHIIGWEHSFVHELHHLLTAIRDDGDVAPHGATLEDGYRAAEVCDAMLRSAQEGGRESVTYR